MRKALYILLSCVFAACSSSPVPKGIIEPAKMQKVVYDIMQADEFLNGFITRDTTVNLKTKRTALYEQVFKIHNTNRKEFYTSYKYYEQHPDIHKALFDSLIQVMDRKRNQKPNENPAKPKMVS